MVLTRQGTCSMPEAVAVLWSTGYALMSLETAPNPQPDTQNRNRTPSDDSVALVLSAARA